MDQSIPRKTIPKDFEAALVAALPRSSVAGKPFLKDTPATAAAQRSSVEAGRTEGSAAAQQRSNRGSGELLSTEGRGVARPPPSPSRHPGNTDGPPQPRSTIKNISPPAPLTPPAPSQSTEITKYEGTLLPQNFDPSLIPPRPDFSDAKVSEQLSDVSLLAHRYAKSPEVLDLDIMGTTGLDRIEKTREMMVRQLDRPVSTRHAMYLMHYISTGFRSAKGSASAVGMGISAAENIPRKVLMEVFRSQGLDEEAITVSIKEGMSAMTTKFFQHEGEITDQTDVKDWGARAKFTEMALKVRKDISASEAVTAAVEGDMDAGDVIALLEKRGGNIAVELVSTKFVTRIISE